MSTKKATKRALLTSILAICLCLVMLIGSTFAWFTDTASTSVNQIQSGTLQLALEMATEWTDGQPSKWENAEGKTLQWVRTTTAEGGTTTKTLVGSNDILWEPGCTYELQPIRISSVGNLALKYKIQITGIDGSAKLNEVIDWTIKNDAEAGENVLAATEYHLTAKGGDNDSDILTIKGHMDENANNNYQGLFIDGIGITVLATQDTVEFDSVTDQYDAKAVYPVAPTLGNATAEGKITAAGAKLGDMTDEASPSAAEIEIPENAVTADTNAIFNMVLTESNPASVTYEISLKNADTDATVTLAEPATVTTNIGAGLSNVKVTHSGVAMQEVTSTGDLTDGTYFYNPGDGKLMICTKSFSPFVISYEFNDVASVNGKGYTTVFSAIAAAKDGDTVVLTKDQSGLITVKGKNITIDLNGKTFNATKANAIQLVENAGVTIQNGTINAQQCGVILFNDGDKLNLDNVKINAKNTNGIGVFGYSTNCTIEIKDSEINSNYIGVCQNGSRGGNTYTITGTTITDTYGVGVYISNSVGNTKQNLTITNCTISGPSGVEMKHTNATITNSTLIGTATPTASGSNNNGTCTDGYALAVTTNGVNDHVTGTVAVSGCKFYSGTTTEGESNGYVFVYKVADSSSVTIDGKVVTDYNTYGGETSGADTQA